LGIFKKACAMKKVLSLLLFVFFAATAIVSCKKDANVAPQVNFEKWFFEKGIYEEFDSSGTRIGIETNTEWTANDYMSLYENGTFELVQYNRGLAGTYVIKDSTMTLTYLQRSGAGTVSTSLDAAIVEKSATKFIFRVEETIDTSTYKSTLYLKK
jgi:hypothetical protein